MIRRPARDDKSVKIMLIYPKTVCHGKHFCNNLNKCIADDGYFLITTFDGDLVHEHFKKNKGVLSSNYTEDGESKKFFEFTRNYSKDEQNINRTGLTYKSFVTLIKDDESKFDTEYIVGKDFLIKELKEKCNLDIVETNLFYDSYTQHEYFFKNNFIRCPTINLENWIYTKMVIEIIYNNS